MTALLISPDAIEQTTRCDKDFACLESSEHPLCKSQYCVDCKVLFIYPPTDSNCAYPVTFGSGDVCTCPVRKEIYRKYGT